MVTCIQRNGWIINSILMAALMQGTRCAGAAPAVDDGGVGVLTNGGGGGWAYYSDIIINNNKAMLLVFLVYVLVTLKIRAAQSGTIHRFRPEVHQADYECPQFIEVVK